MRLKCLLVLVFFGLMVISSISGAKGEVNSCSSPNDTIMKLYSPTNSHGALWNDTNYTYNICCSDIFDSSAPECNPIIYHPETCTNPVVWLENVTNSHAENPQTTYTEDVCYGDLNCRVVDESIPEYCAVDEKEVVALFQDTNSHLTDPNYLPDGIISLWKLDEESGDVIDFIGGNNGVNNGATRGEDGQVGKAFDFDGDDYVEVTDVSDFTGLTAFTLETWVNFDEDSATNPNQDALIYLGSNETVTQGHNYFYLYREEGNLIRLATLDSSENQHILEDTKPVSNNEWHHVVGIWDGNTKYIYIDGEKRIEDSWAGPLISPEGNLYFGTDIDSEGGELTPLQDFFDGIIDEVAIYNRALTPEEIQHRYNQGRYEKKICCKQGGVATPVYWADMSGNLITTAEIGDTVLMVYKDMGAEVGTHDFEIKEGIDYIRTIPASETFANGDDLAAEWTITQEDIEKASSLWHIFEGDTLEFTFKVDGKKSNDLLVEKGSYTNTVPTTQIIKPQYQDTYVINELTGFTGEIPFEQISYDSDDELKLTWDFGDANIEVFENIQRTGLGNTTHNYSTSGTKSILLTAKEMSPPRSFTEAQSDNDATEIYVYGQGINVFAIISEPSPDEITQITERFIDINASATHVANCSYEKSACESAAPQPSDCEVINDTLNPSIGIYCYEFPSTEQNKIKMNWTFYTGNNYEASKQGEYGSDYYQVVEFPHSFNEPGEHTLNLRAIYSI